MNKKEFRTKAYPILLEALLRATNGDNVRVLVSSIEEANFADEMLKSLTQMVSYTLIDICSIELYNKSVVSIGLDVVDGYNSTLEIV